MGVPFPIPGPAVDEIQAVFRRDPDALASGQEVGKVGLFPDLEARKDRFSLQAAGRPLSYLIQPPQETSPDGSVPIDVLEDEIGGREPVMGIFEDIPDEAFIVEGNADQCLPGFEPEVPRCIQRQEGTEPVAVRFQVRMREIEAVQRSEVQQVQTAFRSDPEPVETVLADIADEIALQGRAGSGAEGEQVVPVEPAQAAAGSRQPEESGVVLAYVVDKVAGEAVLHRERASQIIVLEPVLRPEREDRKPEEAGDHDGEFYTS